MIRAVLLSTLFLFQLNAGLAQKPAWSIEKKAKLDEMCNAKLTQTLMVYQDGQLRYSYGDVSKKYRIFSIRKSLVSLMYGVYGREGKIDLYATLEDLGIDDIQGLTKEEKQATVFQLLQAKSGVYHNAAFETPGMVKKRPKRGSHAPGSHWYYNNWDFNALTTIFEQETGLSVFEAFETRLAKPLGMKDFSVDDQEYVLEAERSEHKATLWKLSGRDLMSIGVMMINKGKSGGEQLVPQMWVQKAGTVFSDIGMLGGYGLCWWVAKDGKHYPFVNFPKGTFSARGTGMQDLIVVPEYNMVIVHQTNPSGPDDVMMKVTDLGRTLKLIMDQ